MKLQNKLIASLSGVVLFGAVANAEIPLTDDLSAYGYIDLAYTDSDDDANLEGGFAEFELGFSFSPEDSDWSAVAELSFRGAGVSAGGEDIDTKAETVIISYAASDELSFSVGNILSYQGFETFDATGLFQYSYLGPGGSVVYSAGYAYGGAADYVTDSYAFGLWLGEVDDELSVEFLAAFTGVEDLTLKFIYANDPGYETYNFWASYDIDAFTFAVEYVNNDFVGVDEDDDVYMGLVYYGFGDAGVTFRYSTGDFAGMDFDRYTFSPSYSFSDNVFGLLEVSYEEVDGEDYTTLAAELIYSF
ncbi:MAG: hypothetical protein ACSHX8_14475 [Opitutaceae bacterium]